jgi:hypothetical protein
LLACRQQQAAAKYQEGVQQQQQQLQAAAANADSSPKGGGLLSRAGQVAAAAAGRSTGSLAEQVQRSAQAALSRPASPLTGISRLLQQHPNLRPPHTVAGELRQQPSGRVLAAHVFVAWLAATQQRADEARQQELLAWHHVQHVQAGVWNRWRVAFEERCPHYKLMHAVYRARRHSTLSKAVHRWRLWAPAKHAKRRQLRSAQMALSSSTRRHVWQQLREYAAKRRAKNDTKQHAHQHFRCGWPLWAWAGAGAACLRQARGCGFEQHLMHVPTE